jgi:NADH-quinone oxidoreductase subunit M
MLPMVQRILFNPLDKEENKVLRDLSRREMVVLAPLVAVMIWMGVYPKPFLERMETTVVELLHNVEQKRAFTSPPLAELLGIDDQVAGE